MKFLNRRFAGKAVRRGELMRLYFFYDSFSLSSGWSLMEKTEREEQIKKKFERTGCLTRANQQ
jgi:hypothetical protein